MTKAPISLQDLRRRIYTKAKAEPSWRFWGLYVHVCKREILREAYEMARKNKGAPGIDGVTFEAIEEEGLSNSFFDTVRHDLLMKKVARRVNEGKVLRLLKLILKAGGKRGVPQGGVISPLLANLYLNEVDKMLERAKEVTRCGRHARIEYARFADDLVIHIDGYPRWERLEKAVYRRLLEELAKLDVQLNVEKARRVDLTRGESVAFLGFDFRRCKTRRGKWGVQVTPRMKARTALLRKLKVIFRRYRSQPVQRVIALINPIVRGWVNYFRAGQSRRCFSYVRNWVEKKIRRHLMRARQRKGFGWKRWTRAWLYRTLGLYGDYPIRYGTGPKARPAQ